MKSYYLLFIVALAYLGCIYGAKDVVMNPRHPEEGRGGPEGSRREPGRGRGDEREPEEREPMSGNETVQLTPQEYQYLQYIRNNTRRLYLQCVWVTV